VVRSRCVELKKAVQNHSWAVRQKAPLAKERVNSSQFKCQRSNRDNGRQEFKLVEVCAPGSSRIINRLSMKVLN